MTKHSKIKEPEIGSIAEIRLPSGRKGYARVLKNPLMAFYAVQSERSLSPTEIVGHPIAFKVWVMNSAISSGRWTVIGQAPLEAALTVLPWFFKQDAISKTLSLYQNGIERPATREECDGLERAAVWSAQHIESRLEDHLQGRINKWFEALKC
jgi:hypothetical protein